MCDIMFTSRDITIVLVRALMYRYAVFPQQFPYFEMDSGVLKLNDYAHSCLVDFPTFCESARMISSDDMELLVYYAALCNWKYMSID